MSDKRYLCTDCRRRFPNRGARKDHWLDTKCVHGHGTTIDSDHPAARRARQEDFEQSLAAWIKTARRAVFEDVAGDLPDGAYLAMADEFGLEPEDL